ncbi:MAG: hypothetical protein U0Y10_05440 [Spirosomataceae bacterium]
MAKEKKFEFAPLPTAVLKTESPAPSVATEPELEGSTKVTFECPNAVLEQMKDYGYWEGLTQRDIILEALAIYFEDKTVRERPQKVKDRPKVGRKPKNR